MLVLFQEGTGPEGVGEIGPKWGLHSYPLVPGHWNDPTLSSTYPPMVALRIGRLWLFPSSFGPETETFVMIAQSSSLLQGQPACSMWVT